MLNLFDWIIIVSFFALSMGIALYYRKEAGKDLSSFFLGGRNLPWYIAGISMVATTFAADTPLAVTELVANNGIAGNWLWWCFLAGGMFTTFFFARLWRKAGVLTEVEFIELRYAGAPARWLRGFKAVYLGLFMNVLIIGWVNLALMSILQVFFDLPPERVFWLTGAAMLIAGAYAALSGLKGVAVTDAFQFVIAMGGTIALAWLVIDSEQIGGISGLKSQLPDDTLRFLPVIGSGGADATTLTLGLGSFLAYIGVQWWSSWYPGAEPGGGGYIAQRMMSTRTERDALYATLFFQVAHYCLRPWPWILVGLACIVLYPGLPEEEVRNGYVWAMRDFLPNGLRGLLLVAFFAAYLSTISTQLNWGAGYLVNDVYKRFLNKTAGDSHLVWVSRLTTLVIMALGLAVTTQMESISGVWVFIVECGAGLGMVLILRWFWWRINAWSEIAATFAPFAGYTISHGLLGWVFPNSFFFTVAFTTVCWIVVTFATQPTATETLRKYYRQVEPGGWWPKEFHLADSPRRSVYRYLFVAWLASILMTYGLLFATGKFVLAEFSSGWLAFSLAVGGFLAMLKALQKSGIFRSEN